MIYRGQCDKIRRTEHGEIFWQEMMERKTQISESIFREHVNLSDILDENETWQEYKNGKADDILFFCSSVNFRDVVFFQTCGFEFIWTF